MLDSPVEPRVRGRSTVDGLAVYRRAAAPGGAPRVVIVHGAMDRAAGFVKVGRHLTDLDVVRYDRRGYGRSQDAGVSATFDAQADDLLAVIGEEPAVLFGHSAGGIVALVAAERRPDLVPAVLAFEAPTPWAPWYRRHRPVHAATDASDEQVREAVDGFMDAVVGADRWRSLPPSTRAQRYADGRALLVDMEITSTGTAPFDTTRIAGPVVAAHGTESGERHRLSAQELVKEVPSGELHVVAGAGHMAPDTHPAEVADLVRRAVGLSGF